MNWRHRRPRWSEKIVEKPVERIVEKVVEKIVEKPVEVAVADAEALAERDRQIAHWGERHAEVEQEVVPQCQRARTRGTGAAPAAATDRSGSRALKTLQEVLVAGVRVDPERERTETEFRLRMLRSQLAEREAEVARLSATQMLDRDAARAAGFALKNDDDLEVIEGVGPKIAEVLREAGISTFRALVQLTPAEIKSALERGGPNFRLVNPQTWADQALLAANNRWASLATMQAALVAGTRR